MASSAELVAGWDRRRNNGVGYINKVKLRRARLVQGLVNTYLLIPSKFKM